MGDLISRVTGAFDRFQRRHVVTGVIFATTKRFGDDRGGQLAALVTFYGFLSVFPLILLLLTLAGVLLQNPKIEAAIINSALSQFPVVGDQLAQNIHALTRGNPLALLASVIGLTWGALGVTSSMQHATHTMWRLPREAAPGLWPRTWKGIQLLSALLAVVVLSSIAAAMSTIGAQYFGGGSMVPRLIVFGAALVVNFAGYLLVLWLLSPKDTSIRSLLPGTVLGAVGWTIIQAISGYLLGHQLHHASQIYGFFAVVLGLIFWISLGVQLFLYATELNLVLARHEWPRYVFGEPPLDASPLID